MVPPFQSLALLLGHYLQSPSSFRRSRHAGRLCERKLNLLTIQQCSMAISVRLDVRERTDFGHCDTVARRILPAQYWDGRARYDPGQAHGTSGVKSGADL